jgi:lysophospholipase L1-like esterase
MLGANDTPAGTTQASATASLTSIISTIRALWATTPLFIAEHTIFNLTTNSGVQAAQAAVLDSGSAIYSGGNYDTLTSSSDYWDNTHPNATGAAAMASIAVTAITAHP